MASGPTEGAKVAAVPVVPQSTDAARTNIVPRAVLRPGDGRSGAPCLRAAPEAGPGARGGVFMSTILAGGYSVSMNRVGNKG